MPKHLIQLFSVLLLALFLTACGGGDDADNDNADNNTQGNDDQEEMADDNDTGDDNTNNMDGDTADKSDNTNDTNGKNQAGSDQDMIDKMDNLAYAEFEMEVDYGKNNDYTAEIEQDKNQNMIESEVEDEVKENIDIMGQKAFDKVYPNIKNLTIDRNTSKKDAINETLQAFDLESDYKEFEMGITFQDGTKIEFEDK